jgi:hypothetical protein
MTQRTEQRGDSEAARPKRGSWAALIVLIAAIGVAFPASALASAALVATDGAHGTDPTTATVEGNGYPEGQTTTVHVDYPWPATCGVQATAQKGRQPKPRLRRSAPAA